MGQTIVIVNDYQIASELLTKRSSIYSSRPDLIFASRMSVSSAIEVFIHAAKHSIVQGGLGAYSRDADLLGPIPCVPQGYATIHGLRGRRGAVQQVAGD